MAESEFEDEYCMTATGPLAIWYLQFGLTLKLLKKVELI